MFKLKLKNFSKSRRGSGGSRTGVASEDWKEQERERKKLTISGPINLEENSSRLQEETLEIPPQQTLDLATPKELDIKEEVNNVADSGGVDGPDLEDSPAQSTVNDQQIVRDEVNLYEEEVEVAEERTSSDDGTEEDSLPELFKPTSPLHINKNFILPDIMEESENDQSESQRSSLLSCDGLMNRSQNRPSKFDPFEETGLDVVETNFDDDDVPLPDFDASYDHEGSQNTSGSPPEPPILPVSPPPGPLLSPRYSMMMSPAKIDTISHDKNRFSIISECPPPLPTSLPPGNLIPRESMYHDSDTKVDLWYELMKGKKSELEVNSSQVENYIDENKDNSKGDPAPEPKVYIDEQSHKLVNHLTSDSGFPDTDIGNSHSDLSAGKTAEHQINGSHALTTASNKTSSVSATSYSDERTTEYSGSLGLKTNASSGSQHSPSEAKSDSDDDNSLATQFDNGAKNEPEIEPQLSPPFSPTDEGSFLKAAIRKTGWLEVKTVLVRKNRKVAMASKRKWKKYWATLRGSFLLFYQCNDGRMDYDSPEIKLDLAQGLAHTVHDHVKRDHIFCLSTSNGNTYYMQTTSHSEVDDWITNIHCAAATVLTEHQSKEEAIAVLKENVDKLNEEIDKESKLKNLTELAATNTSIKSMASDQLTVCSENIEKYKINLYRIRCYIASLEGHELPNPQSLLASVSKPTKVALGRVGMFSVASLNAIVCSRTGIVTSASTWSLRPRLSIPSSPSAIFRRKSKTESPKRPRIPHVMKASKRDLEISEPFAKMSPASSPGSTSRLTARERSRSLSRSPDNRRIGLDFFRSFSPHSSPLSGPKTASKQKGARERNRSTPELRTKEISGPYPIVLTQRSPLATPLPPITPISEQADHLGISELNELLQPPNDTPVSPTTLPNDVVKISLPQGIVAELTLHNDMTVNDLLDSVCEKYNLNTSDHFLRLTIDSQEGKFDVVPNGDIAFKTFNCFEVEVCQKSIKSVTLHREENEIFGFILAPKYDEELNDVLKSVTVESIIIGSLAETKGFHEGDEVMLISDKNITELGWTEIQHLMESASTLTMTLRSKSSSSVLSPSPPPILDSLICPAPPTHQAELTGEHLLQITVPRPESESSEGTLMDRAATYPSVTQDQIDLLLNDSREVSKLLTAWETSQPSVRTTLTRADKLRKSATDLVETEHEYVMHLESLVKRFLEPLRDESFLPQDEVKALIGNIPDILNTQRNFLKCLEGSLKLEQDHPVEVVDTESKLSLVVCGISQALVDFAEHFREYGTFCSSRQKIQRILSHDGHEELQKFIGSRSQDGRSTPSIESLLAKPMVRISRYPLFINAMMDNTLPDSEEKAWLQDALKVMTHVADYINEVQRLCETYGSVIDSLSKDQAFSEVGEGLKMSKLKEHSEVMWLNPADEHLARGLKKGQGPVTVCLVFDTFIVLFCLDKKYKRKDSKGHRELAVMEDDIRSKVILPCIECNVYDLPDSDGVTNMWRLQYTATSTPEQHTNYLLRSQSSRQKLVILENIKKCIQQQQGLCEAHRHWDKAVSMSALGTSKNSQKIPALTHHQSTKIN